MVDMLSKFKDGKQDDQRLECVASKGDGGTLWQTNIAIENGHL